MEIAPNIPFRPLGLIMNVIEGCGFTLGHLYDDLVFTEENVIILKMEEERGNISFYVNQDCEANADKDMSATLKVAAEDEGLQFTRRGTYRLSPSDDQSFQVMFRDD